MEDRYTKSQRGFIRADAIEGLYGGDVETYVSSGASCPQLWVKARMRSNLNDPNAPLVEATVLLTRADAVQLANDLLTLAVNHYQGPIDEVCE